jgi:hypothetical protein
LQDQKKMQVVLGLILTEMEFWQRWQMSRSKRYCCK